MQITLPKSERHPLVQITVSAPGHRDVMMFDESHSTVEIKLPDGVREEQVSILAEFCDQFNQVDRWAEKHTLKEAEKVQSRRETQREARKEPETITAPEVTDAVEVLDLPAETEPEASPANTDLSASIEM